MSLYRRCALVGFTLAWGHSFLGCGSGTSSGASLGVDSGASVADSATNVADSDAKPRSDVSPAPTPSADYFPPVGSSVWEAADTTGWSSTGLEALVKLVEENRSSSFMLLADGRIVLEKYFMGANESTRTDVASVQKSFTSTLLGIARDRGLLTFDDKVSDHLAAGWSKASPSDEGSITLRHLMTHSSGLDPDTLARKTEPGKVFAYNTNAYQKLRLVLEKVSGQDINATSKAWLFDAVGIGGAWTARGSVDRTGSPLFGLELSARDMARFGLLAQRGGVWSGQAVTSAGWFAEAWTPCATKADYGLLWWLQGKGSLSGAAPPDMVSALGARDQKIYVSPQKKLVVTRQGLAAGTASEAESDFDRLLVKAIADARL